MPAAGRGEHRSTEVHLTPLLQLVAYSTVLTWATATTCPSRHRSYVRSLVWGAGIAGLAMMLFAII
jgi:uncharacterized MAPEG superfamily protein